MERSHKIGSITFPINDMFTLTAGKFPLSDYTDLFKPLQKYTLNGNNKNIEVILTDFDISCTEGKINKYGPCRIEVDL